MTLLNSFARNRPEHGHIEAETYSRHIVKWQTIVFDCSVVVLMLCNLFFIISVQWVTLIKKLITCMAIYCGW